MINEKEKIIIDGVDVSECRHLKNDGIKKPICRGGGCAAIYKSCLCANNTDCDYKQLVRKTQECEELKKQLETSEKWRIAAESLNEKLDLKNTRYRKALEEIEEIAKNFGSYAAWQEQRINKILDIINKAKGEGKCQ